MHSSRVALVLRLAPLALVPVMLAASMFPGEFQVSPRYWASSCCAAVVFAFGARWPVAASLVLSGLAVPMLAAEAWGLSGLVPYLGALAVADVAARTDRNPVIVAVAGCWATALLLGNWLDDHASIWTAAGAVTVAAGVGLPILLGLYLRGQKRLAATYLERAAAVEKGRAAAESAIRSQERMAMARELHDLVAHHMASIVLRVGVAEHAIDGVDPRVAAVLADVHGTASDALADIRRLQDALRDPALDEVAMIESEAVWTEVDAAVARSRAAGFTVASDVDDHITGLDAIARLTLLRVTQEALTNVMKHADPGGPVDLTIERRDGGVGVVVRSIRRREPQAEVDGHGIIGMTERLNLIGGHLDLGRTGPAWEVRAWLPQSVPTGSDARR